ncbi:MAG TPA: hypothetical protein ENN43_03055 [bacterium]|nr:hypothetical protein [bacterium]
MSYENTIYPLQDKVLAALEKSGTPFYLTGGTALSRFYFNHRYSDDLDFFVNDDAKFHDYLNSAFTAIKHAGVEFSVKMNDDRFARIIAEGDLKVEFVNDIPFYLGEPVKIKDAPFSRIDNLMNILANKITAFKDRDEVKDIVDIREIANSINPDWKLIFEAAGSKAAGVFPPLIAEKMERFNPDLIETAKWIKRPAADVFAADIQRIIKEMLKVE